MNDDGCCVCVKTSKVFIDMDLHAAGQCAGPWRGLHGHYCGIVPQECARWPATAHLRSGASAGLSALF